MAKKQPATRRKRASLTPKDKAPPRSVEALKSVAVVLAVALIVAGGGLWGLNAVWRYAVNSAEFRLVPARQVMVGRDGRLLSGKPWVDFPALQSHWLEVGRDTQSVLARYASLFERDLTREVYRDLAGSPWVREVAQVRRAFPNRLEIRLALREPTFRVIYEDTVYLLDEDSVVLDLRFFRACEEVLARPAIRFERNPGLFETGKTLPDNGVKGAMYLIDVLEATEVGGKSILEQVPIEEIVVQETPPDSAGRIRSLTLRPARGGRVVWGRPPVPHLPPSPAEAEDRVKLANLVSMLRTYADSLEHYVIDVRFDNPIARPVRDAD